MVSIVWKPPGTGAAGKIDLAAFEFHPVAGGQPGTLVLTEASSKKRASLHVVAGREALSALAPHGLEIFDAGLAELVEPDHRLSAEVALKPTPGHTPGHVSVSIESRGQRALITGDMMHHPCQIARPDWSPPFDEDPVQSLATRHAVLDEVGDSDVLVIGTHFAAPTAGLIVRDGEAWRFEGQAGGVAE